jgi:zinc transport system ATP-binding protein
MTAKGSGSDMERRKILEISGVSAGYDEAIVLKDIDLTVYERDFIGIIGANGSGKTTLLKVILGLLRPLTGSLRFFFDGGAHIGKHIGYLPQVANFDQKFPITVTEVVMSGLMARTGLLKRFSPGDRKRIEAILTKTGILHLRKRPMGELSGGQMQRVFLARALVSSPQLLILDEPDTFVDQSFEGDLYEILKDLNREIAIILVSHDIGMISAHVKTIACVSRRLYYHDSSEITQELMDNYNCPIELITHGRVPHRVLKDHA